MRITVGVEHGQLTAILFLFHEGNGLGVRLLVYV
jgi:hypothetical protein